MVFISNCLVIFEPPNEWYNFSVYFELIIPFGPEMSLELWICIFNYFHRFYDDHNSGTEDDIITLLGHFSSAFSIADLPNLFDVVERELLLGHPSGYIMEFFEDWVLLDYTSKDHISFIHNKFQLKKIFID